MKVNFGINRMEMSENEWRWMLDKQMIVVKNQTWPKCEKWSQKDEAPLLSTGAILIKLTSPKKKIRNEGEAIHTAKKIHLLKYPKFYFILFKFFPHFFCQFQIILPNFFAVYKNETFMSFIFYNSIK